VGKELSCVRKYIFYILAFQETISAPNSTSSINIIALSKKGYKKQRPG
jgi:hypothetical protein